MLLVSKLSEAGPLLCLTSMPNLGHADFLAPNQGARMHLPVCPCLKSLLRSDCTAKLRLVRDLLGGWPATQHVAASDTLERSNKSHPCGQHCLQEARQDSLQPPLPIIIQ